MNEISLEETLKQWWKAFNEDPSSDEERCKSEVVVSSLKFSSIHARCMLKNGHETFGVMHWARGAEEADRSFKPYTDLTLTW